MVVCEVCVGYLKVLAGHLQPSWFWALFWSVFWYLPHPAQQQAGLHRAPGRRGVQPGPSLPIPFSNCPPPLLPEQVMRDSLPTTGPRCKYKHTRAVFCPNFMAGFCLEGKMCKYAQCACAFSRLQQTQWLSNCVSFWRSGMRALCYL